MKTKTNLRRTDEFDRGREFVVVRNITVSGKPFRPGDPFDQTLVTVRRLRQMYDMHLIDIPQSSQPGAETVPLSDEELITRLTEGGIVPRPGASRAWLLRKAQELGST